MQAPGPMTIIPEIGADFVTMPDGYKLSLRSWEPVQARALVIAVHGFNDYSKAFINAGRFLAQHNIAVYAYDQRGFGANKDPGIWPGSNALVADLSVVVNLLKTKHSDLPVYVMGESMGGAVVMLASAQGRLAEAKGLVLSAPAVWGRDFMPWYQKGALWFMRKFFPDTKLSGRGLGKMASDNIEMLRDLSRDPLFIKQTRVDAIEGVTNIMGEALKAAGSVSHSCLILYGEKDEIIPKEPVLRAAEQIPHHDLRLYPTGWHMLTRDLQADIVLKDIVAWLK